MLTTIIVFLYLPTTLNADYIGTRLVSATSTSTLASTTGSKRLSSANTLSSTSTEVKNELVKIATTCFSQEDLELLTGNTLRHGFAQIFAHILIEESARTVGLRELRSALKLPPPAPWQPQNRTKPTEHELASASTIEEYYELREPRSKMRSLDSDYLFEHNVATAIAFLNKRLPSIQTAFRKTFEEFCPSTPKVLNKKEIDGMVEAFYTMSTSIDKAVREMLSRDELDFENQLSLNGRSNPEQVDFSMTNKTRPDVFDDNEIGPVVSHLYQISNRGPSEIDAATLNIFLIANEK